MASCGAHSSSEFQPPTVLTLPKSIAEEAPEKDGPRAGRPPRVLDPLDGLLGERVRQRRTWLGWSSRQLGEAVGVSFQQIRRYEIGADRMSAAALIRICTAMGTSIGELCSGVGDGSGNEVIQAAEAGAARSAGRVLEDFLAIRDQVVRKQLTKLIASLAASSRRGQVA